MPNKKKSARPPANHAANNPEPETLAVDAGPTGVNLAAVSATIRTSFSGPLPPPAVLAEYEAILPGAAERIFRHMEGQSSHRKTMEMIGLQGELSNSRLGTKFSFVLGILGLGVSAYFAFLGYATAGASLFVVGVVALSGLLVAGRHSQRKEREKRAKVMAEAFAPRLPNPEQKAMKRK